MTQLVRIAELDIDPAQLDAYKALLTEEIAAAMALEPGVLALHAVSLKATPTKIRIFEIYASDDAYRLHIETPHFLKYKLGTEHMVLALTLLDFDPILLAAK